MGLDNHLSIYSRRIELNESIVEALKLHDIQLCGFDGYSFRGKVYRVIVHTICNESLYGILCPSTLGDMALQINDFLHAAQAAQAAQAEPASQAAQAEPAIDVRQYIQDYDDTYPDDDYEISKKELESLRDVFQFCYDNNLYLHPDY